MLDPRSLTDLSLEIIDLVIKTRDLISREQCWLATLPPPVSHHQDCPPHKWENCNKAWMAAWILVIGCQVVHVDSIFQLRPYQAVEAIRALVVPGMSEHCLELTIERTVEGDGFDYVDNVCTAALTQLGL